MFVYIFFKWTHCFVNIFSFVKMTSHCFNSNLVLNVWANVALQSIITLIANFSSIKILLIWLFGSSTSAYLDFYNLNDILLTLTLHYDLILLPYVFHLTTIFHHYLLLFLLSIPFLSYVFLLISNISIYCIPQKFQDISFFIS